MCQQVNYVRLKRSNIFRVLNLTALHIKILYTNIYESQFDKQNIHVYMCMRDVAVHITIIIASEEQILLTVYLHIL